jgi:GNAT superfamily N-acetyltransferase
MVYVSLTISAHMEIHELKDETERREAVPILRQLWSDADPDEILAWTGENDYRLFGRYDDVDVVGIAGVLTTHLLHHARHAWLYDLVVDEPRRGAGHGTALIEFVEEWAEENGCKYVALASPVAKGDVHRYYENRDYEKWGYVIEKELR